MDVGRDVAQYEGGSSCEARAEAFLGEAATGDQEVFSVFLVLGQKDNFPALLVLCGEFASVSTRSACCGVIPHEVWCVRDHLGVVASC